MAVLGFVSWASITNAVMPEAVDALKSRNGVQVDQKSGSDWLVFQPDQENVETGLIFYPGGKVDYRAYAPFAQQVASQGFLVVIPKMPLNLAVFGVDEAAKIIQGYPHIRHWAVGGHSLGGSMAAHFAFQNPGKVSGLVLLASYPAPSDSLADQGLKVVTIFGTQDGLATGSKMDASRSLLPADTQYVAIAGGNHAQFGYYGVQSGDHPAAISREAQQQETVLAVVKLLKSLSGK